MDVDATPLPVYPWERPGTHRAGGWLIHRDDCRWEDNIKIGLGESNLPRGCGLDSCDQGGLMVGCFVHGNDLSCSVNGWALVGLETYKDVAIGCARYLVNKE